MDIPVCGHLVSNDQVFCLCQEPVSTTELFFKRPTLLCCGQHTLLQKPACDPPLAIQDHLAWAITVSVLLGAIPGVRSHQLQGTCQGVKSCFSG